MMSRFRQPSERAMTIEDLVAKVKARGKASGLEASVYNAVHLAVIELGFDVAVDGTIRPIAPKKEVPR